MKWLIYVTAIWFFAGCSITLAHADFGVVSIWDDFYFIWEAVTLLLSFILVYNLIPNNLKWVIKPVIIYSSIRLLWLIVIPAMGVVANHPMAVSITSWIFITGAIIVFGADLVKEWKRK